MALLGFEGISQGVTLMTRGVRSVIVVYGCHPHFCSLIHLTVGVFIEPLLWL